MPRRRSENPFPKVDDVREREGIDRAGADRRILRDSRREVEATLGRHISDHLSPSLFNARSAASTPLRHSSSLHNPPFRPVLTAVHDGRRHRLHAGPHAPAPAAERRPERRDPRRAPAGPRRRAPRERRSAARDPSVRRDGEGVPGLRL
jgi:hypothetical protein